MSNEQNTTACESCGGSGTIVTSGGEGYWSWMHVMRCPCTPEPPPTAEEVFAASFRRTIGIDQALHVFEGGSEVTCAAPAQPADRADDYEWNPLPPAERVKLADEMIRRWTAYREAAIKPSTPDPAAPSSAASSPPPA